VLVDWLHSSPSQRGSDTSVGMMIRSSSMSCAVPTPKVCSTVCLLLLYSFFDSLLILHGSLPSGLIDDFCQMADAEVYRWLCSSSSLSLIISRTRLSTVGNCIFLVTAAYVWDSLCEHVTSTSSVAVFRSCLKIYPFDISYFTLL